MCESVHERDFTWTAPSTKRNENKWIINCEKENNAQIFIAPKGKSVAKCASKIQCVVQNYYLFVELRQNLHGFEWSEIDANNTRTHYPKDKLAKQVYRRTAFSSNKFHKLDAPPQRFAATTRYSVRFVDTTLPVSDRQRHTTERQHQR